MTDDVVLRVVERGAGTRRGPIRSATRIGAGHAGDERVEHSAAGVRGLAVGHPAVA